MEWGTIVSSRASGFPALPLLTCPSVCEYKCDQLKSDSPKPDARREFDLLLRLGFFSGNKKIEEQILPGEKCSNK